jgi:hypothetical protein
MVMKIVNVAHALSASALTTTIPRPAIVMTRMKRMAIAPTTPATGPTSVRAISASERPPRRVDAHKQMKSCTAPARQTPATSQMKPGAYPNCAASTGPTSGPEPAIAAK